MRVRGTCNQKNYRPIYPNFHREIIKIARVIIRSDHFIIRRCHLPSAPLPNVYIYLFIHRRIEAKQCCSSSLLEIAFIIVSSFLSFYIYIGASSTSNPKSCQSFSFTMKELVCALRTRAIITKYQVPIVSPKCYTEELRYRQSWKSSLGVDLSGKTQSPYLKVCHLPHSWIVVGSPLCITAFSYVSWYFPSSNWGPDSGEGT